MSKRIRMFSVALVVFVVALMAFAGTALAAYSQTPSPAFAIDHSKVSQGPNDFHNLAPAGSNPCDYCHIPHGAQGAFLWATAVTNNHLQIGHADAGKNTSDIEALCYSCHDGTTDVNGGVVTVGDSTVFSANYWNHRTTAASTLKSDGVTPTGPGSDCDRCHNPHDNTNRNFLRLEVKTRVYDKNGVYVGNLVPPVTGAAASRYATVIKGGDVCATCHEENLPDGPYPGLRGTHPVYQPAGTSVYESIAFGLSNPVPGSNANSVWPKTGSYEPTVDPSHRNGNRLFDPATGLVSTNHTTAVVMCESCHSPHGALAGTETEDATVHILNTMNADTLCGNCH